ncbi:MAG: D-alanine--D-alanine ligase [Deltaproteobacteria bacterium]|nr:D-alanine--D-alanine ligase [Deltaproteobacteria bacterium]
MKQLHIALLSGGISSERKISLKSGDHVYAALDRQKYIVTRYDPKTDINRLVSDAPEIDAAFIAMHGPMGEDGTIQGLLDLLDIPYQGSGVPGSAMAMNKLVSKQLYKCSGIPVPPYIVINHNTKINSDDCIKRLDLPIIVKPVNGGSSLGMSIVYEKNKLQKAIDKAFEHDNTILLEAYIKGIELTVGIIGNASLNALPVIEIIPDKQFDFFNHTAKYEKGATNEICPARIGDALTEKAQSYAKTAHNALFCSGYSRTDMILQKNDIYILETNTIPGMTLTSLFPLAAEKAGLSFDRLLDLLINLSIEEHKQKRTGKARDQEEAVV